MSKNTCACHKRKRRHTDEWDTWRGRVVRYLHHTYCTSARCTPKCDNIDYVIVGGAAADAIRAITGDTDDYLVLVPITRDTDEDSYVLVKREDIIDK